MRVNAASQMIAPTMSFSDFHSHIPPSSSKPHTSRWLYEYITTPRTSKSETIRKPPLVKAQTALKNKDFQYGGWNSYTCNVACGSGIMTVNSPSGSTPQCDTWLWDNMPLNSLKRPPYWNSTSGFHFHKSPQSTCQSVTVCEILSKSDHLGQKKMTSCRFSRWQISAILDCRDPIMGSLKSPVKFT